MIRLNKNATLETIIVTLEDMKVYNNSTYQFTFTNTATQKDTIFEVSATDDQSNYKERCNKFLINTSEVFADADAGQYIYKVVEVESGKVLEQGKMDLAGDAVINVMGYSEQIKYTTYNG